MSSVLPTPASSAKGLPSLHRPPVPQRVVLRDQADDLREQVEEERSRRSAAQKRMEQVRERMARLEKLSGDLVKAREEHSTFVERKHEAEAARRKLPTGTGMMTFATENFGNGNHVKPKRPGPNSRRTAFVTDYKGHHILGESEFAHKKAINTRAESVMEQRASERRAASPTKRAAGPPPATAESGDGASAPGAEPTTTTPPPPKAATPAPRLAASSKKSVNAPPAGVGGAGSRLRANGLPTLESAKHGSSRRTKFYTTYDGKRMMMDPSDWPDEDGVVFVYTSVHKSRQ